MSRHGKVRVKIDKALIQRQVQSGGKGERSPCLTISHLSLRIRCRWTWGR